MSAPEPQPEERAAGQTLVVGRPAVGDPNYNEQCPQCNPLSVADFSVQLNFLDPYVGRGLRKGMAAIFIAGEMAGIGMLAAPWAVVNLGWVGVVMLILFGIATAYTSSCLGTCWLILEERYMQCRQYPCNDPFATIAYYAFGKKMSYFTIACIQITLFGAATVYLMLVAQSAQKLFTDVHPEISFCTWLLVFSITISSLMFFESPKNYCIVAFGAVLTTMTACYFVILQILLDDKINEDMNATVPHNGWDANQFFLSYGTILFTYGGASAFPTIQNDMFKKDEFSRSIIATFLILATLFGAVVLAGYFAYGDEINPNILMSLGDSWLSYIAIVLMACHLILGFVIIVSPVSKNIENLLNTPDGLGFQKFFIRVGLLMGMILLGESIPDFSYLVALIGSSTVTLATFVLPSIFYLRLSAEKSALWPDRSLSWKSKICVYFIITVGLLGGGAAVVTAVRSIMKLKPCYWSYISPATYE